MNHITYQNKKLKGLMFTHCLLGNTYKYMVQMREFRKVHFLKDYRILCKIFEYELF
jgi:hypothetical protein